MKAKQSLVVPELQSETLGELIPQSHHCFCVINQGASFTSLPSVLHDQPIMCMEGSMVHADQSCHTFAQTLSRPLECVHLTHKLLNALRSPDCDLNWMTQSAGSQMKGVDFHIGQKFFGL